MATPVLVLVATGVLSGCHTWTEMEPGPVPVGTRVRVTLTPEEAVRQVEGLGSLRQVVPGTVVQGAGEGMLALATPRGGASPGTRGFNDYLSVPWSQVVRLEGKQLSLTRSVGLAAGMGVGAALILSVTDGSARDGNGETPGPNQAVRIPLLRFWF